MTIEPGTLVTARTAGGEDLPMRALSGPEQGKDFQVVWVCTDEEYQRAVAAGDTPDGLPWPLSAVKVPEPA